MEAARRTVLKAGALGALGTAGTSVLPWGSLRGKRASELPEELMPRPFRQRFRRPPVLRPYRTATAADGAAVDHYELVERQGRAVLVAGRPTRVFGYNGVTPGPTVSVEQGRRTLLRVRNQLPSVHPGFGNDFTTSTHLHGSASLPQFDGYASDVSPPGFYKDYLYSNDQPARTIWYHDHGVHHTTENAYAGMYAQYHVHDPVERALLPQGEFDVPLTIVDVSLRRDGRLRFDDRSESGLMGDIVLVNGVPWPVMRVKRRVYRFRILNVSGARSYRFALDTGDPVVLVATDGGLVPVAQEIDQWRVSTSERYEILIDFRRYLPGRRVVLRNLSNDNNVDYADTDKVMAFDVTDEPVDKGDPTWNTVPHDLVTSEVMELTAGQATRTRHLRFERQGGLWKINETTWDDVVASDFRLLLADPGLGDVEVWEIENRSGGWFHPVHVHLVDFKVLDRNGKPPRTHERGPKDTVYLGENETVRIVMRFGPHRGRYMVHCHNTSHEDHDMMAQYAVGWKPGDPDPNHPILAAPPRVDDLPRPRA
jgi:spore coat protein A, manganese oxidase